MIDGVRMCFVMLHSSLCLDVFIVIHVWMCSLCYMIGCVSSCFIDTYVSIMLAKILILLFTSLIDSFGGVTSHSALWLDVEKLLLGKLIFPTRLILFLRCGWTN